METSLPRLSVFSSDLQRITGKSERSCQRLMQQIRDVFELKQHQLVTIYQVSDYLGIPIKKLVPFLKG